MATDMKKAELVELGNTVIGLVASGAEAVLVEAVAELDEQTVEAIHATITRVTGDDPSRWLRNRVEEIRLFDQVAEGDGAAEEVQAAAELLAHGAGKLAEIMPDGPADTVLETVETIANSVGKAAGVVDFLADVVGIDLPDIGDEVEKVAERRREGRRGKRLRRR